MIFAGSWRSTKFATKAICYFIFVLVCADFTIAQPSIHRILRDSAIRNGLRPANELVPAIDPERAALGEQLFESTAVSLNSEVSCKACHLDEFGSADGLPNAIGVGGIGSGLARIESGGAIIPRNTLGLWGVGGNGFDVFFWDGRVDASVEPMISQFGDDPPSGDPLVVATHLPVLVIREMLTEDELIAQSKSETVDAAELVYESIVSNVREQEPQLANDLAAYLGLDVSALRFVHIAGAIADFIRLKFAVRSTDFHEFVFGEGELSEDELRGALTFYGKGKCSTCHSGAYFTDFKFHTIPQFQLGFGVNGFGVDYGRFNVSQNSEDLYRFRTPVLYNVVRTAPYGHSGAHESLESVLLSHVDPLRDQDFSEWSAGERGEFYRQLTSVGDDRLLYTPLDDVEIAQLIAFLGALSFE